MEKQLKNFNEITLDNIYKIYVNILKETLLHIINQVLDKMVKKLINIRMNHLR